VGSPFARVLAPPVRVGAVELPAARPHRPGSDHAARPGRPGWALASLCLLAGCGRPDIEIPQFVRDGLVLDAVLFALGDAYRGAVGEGTVGAIDAEVRCSLGGSATIRGTVTDRAADLSFELHGCRVSYVDPDSVVSVTSDGAISYNSTAAASGIFEDYHAANLTLEGDLTFNGVSIAIDDACAMSAFFSQSAVSAAIAGKLCDRDVTQVFSHRACGG